MSVLVPIFPSPWLLGHPIFSMGDRDSPGRWDRLPPIQPRDLGKVTEIAVEVPTPTPMRIKACLCAEQCC